MEDGGFTIIKPEEEGPDRHKVTDSIGLTTVHGITQD
jgi:hypothetical protein